MARLPGLRPSRCAVGLRGFSTGHPALAKNWRAFMPATLRAIPPPARRVIRGPRVARAASRAARPAMPGAFLPVGAHLCATSLRSGRPARCGRAQVRSYKGHAGLEWRITTVDWLFGSAPCARQTYAAVPSAWLSRTGCAPTDKAVRRRRRSDADAQRGSVLRATISSFRGLGRAPKASNPARSLTPSPPATRIGPWRPCAPC